MIKQRRAFKGVFTSILLFFLVFFILAAAPGCTGRQKRIDGLDPALGNSIYLVGHHWHAGIVVRTADIPDGVWPQHQDFADAEYLEVGWGDADFYQIDELQVRLAMKALFLPTSSVLHIVGFNGPVENYFTGSEIIEFKISEENLKELSSFIEEGYAMDENGQPIMLGPGIYGNSRFYASTQSYHLFRTCNVWSASSLRAAGIPISSWFSFTVDELIGRAARYGTRR